MPLELHCPYCQESFEMPSESRAAHVLDQLLLEGPWWSVGDGATPEDQVSTALGGEDGVCCPGCGCTVPIDEEGLGQFTRELLGQW